MKLFVGAIDSDEVKVTEVVCRFTESVHIIQRIASKARIAPGRDEQPVRFEDTVEILDWLDAKTVIWILHLKPSRSGFKFESHFR